MSTRDLLRANDARFHALAGGFSADEWSQPSLCDGWSNHDVLAHLVVGYGAGPGVVASEMLRHSGSFDRANAALARSLAATRSPGELLDDFGRLTRRPRGLGRYFPPRLLLGDHITHELDMLFALNREPAIPVDAFVAVLNTQVAVPNPFVPAFRNSRGLRLIGHRRGLDARRARSDRPGPRRRAGVRAGQPARDAGPSRRRRCRGAGVAGQ